MVIASLCSFPFSKQLRFLQAVVLDRSHCSPLDAHQQLHRTGAAMTGNVLQMGPCQRWKKEGFHHVCHRQNPAYISHDRRYLSGNRIMLLTLVHLLIYYVFPHQAKSSPVVLVLTWCWLLHIWVDDFLYLSTKTFHFLRLNCNFFFVCLFVLIIYPICQKYSEF